MKKVGFEELEILMLMFIVGGGLVCTGRLEDRN